MLFYSLHLESLLYPPFLAKGRLQSTLLDQYPISPHQFSRWPDFLKSPEYVALYNQYMLLEGQVWINTHDCHFDLRPGFLAIP